MIPHKSLEAEVNSALYCPEFGRRLQAPVLVMRKEEALPFALSMRIVLTAFRGVR